MGKSPAFLFYPSDWSRDLEEHPLEIEGAWIRICCKLWWSESRGELTRTLCQWAKILRVDESDAKRIIDYIKTWKIGDVEIDCNGNVTVISRRMKNDEKSRIINNERRMRHYYRNKCNADVTGDVTPTSQRSSVSVSYSVTNNPPISPQSGGTVSSVKDDNKSSRPTDKKKKSAPNVAARYSDDFMRFWAAYPRRVGKDAAWRAWQKRNGDRPPIDSILSAIERQKATEQWQKDGGQYIPHPSTWINQGRWSDEVTVEFEDGRTRLLMWAKQRDEEDKRRLQ